jgi:hypothetical protein
MVTRTPVWEKIDTNSIVNPSGMKDSSPGRQSRVEGTAIPIESRQGRQKRELKKLHDSAFGIFDFRLIENWIIWEI